MRVMELIHVAIGDEGEPRRSGREIFRRRCFAAMVTHFEQSDGVKQATRHHVIVPWALGIAGQQNAAAAVG